MVSGPAGVDSGAIGSELWVVHLGQLGYRDATELQQALRAARGSDTIADTLLLLEHPPVYTLGRRTEVSDLPLPADWYRQRGITIESSDRGGRVTYHGPGQLVGYPIMRIASVADYVHTMEKALIASLADHEIDATVYEALTGVWIADRKIASIGVHVSRSVTTHGFAVNVENDLRPFDWIVACGIAEVRMTSMTLETGASGLMADFRRSVAKRFAQSYGLTEREISQEQLLAAIPASPTPAQVETGDPSLQSVGP